MGGHPSGMQTGLGKTWSYHLLLVRLVVYVHGCPLFVIVYLVELAASF